MYSLDFRHKVLEVRKKEGLSLSAVARRFGVGVASVMRWWKRIQPFLTRTKPATKIDREVLAGDVLRYPDHFLYERARRFGVTPEGIRHALKQLKVTYKKKPPASQGLSRGTWSFSKKDGNVQK